MDKIINSKVNKQAIYEIYRACRLCGAGAGYKMPIIQNVLDIDGDEVELRYKIRECVQIEVNHDDKMPPLICELCVDKVNDFYEFMEMCRQTNKRTRRTLGLPLQTTSKGTADAGDCILGVTEPVFIKKETDEPRSSPRNVKSKESKPKKPQVKVEINSKQSKDSHSRSKRGRSPSPRSTRRSRSSNEDNVSLSNLKSQPKKTRTLPPPPKSILKKSMKIEESPSLRSKRLREPLKSEVPQKKVKLSVRLSARPLSKIPAKPPAKPLSKTVTKPVVKTALPECQICKQRFKTAQALANHLRSHTIQFTSPKLACNSCCEWFETLDSAYAHHKRHKTKPIPYECRGCTNTYKSLQAYDQHTSVCVPWVEVPDVKCQECWRYFPTDTLREQHKCLGEDGRPGGKCQKCKRTYSLLKNLMRHESTCTVKRKINFQVDPELMKDIKPLQILVSKCDPLLKKEISDHYDVSSVAEYYGLDTNSVYPYLKTRSLNLNSMVNIKSELDDFYCEEDYVHWDSDVSEDLSEEENVRNVYSLFTLSLKTLFSRKCLGRVPRKRRRIKTEKSVFDSLVTDFDTDMSKNIDSIIDNLGIDDDKDDEKDDKIDNKDDDMVDNRDDDKVDNNVDDKFDNKDDDKVDNKDNDKIYENVDDSDKSNHDDVQSNNTSTQEHTEINDTIHENSLNNEENNFMNSNVNNDSHNDGKTAENDKKLENNEYNDVKNSKEADSVNVNSGESVISSNIDEESNLLEDNKTDGRDVETNLVCNDSVSELTADSQDSKSEVEENCSEISTLNDIKNDLTEVEEDNLDTTRTSTDEKEIDESLTTENKSCKTHKEKEVPVSESINEDETLREEKEDTHKADNDRKEKICKNDDSEVNDFEVNTNPLNYIDTERSTREDDEKYDDKDDKSNLNGDIDDKSDKLNMDDFNEATDAEIDDKKLMEAIDEHIGENNEEENDESSRVIKEIEDSANVSENDGKNTNCSNDKITLEDLIPNTGSETKSMDLDSISDDDFNFD